MKLVRDRIGDIPWSDEESKRYLGRVGPHGSQYRDLLRAKLREEVDELLEADRAGESGDLSPDGRQAVLEEVADVYEVLRALLFTNGTPAALLDTCIRDAADAKSGERGGFFHGRTFDDPNALDHDLESGA